MRCWWFIVLVGCYEPGARPSMPCTPGTNESCPSGQTCVTGTNGSFCMDNPLQPDAPNSADASIDSAAAADAAIDAPLGNFARVQYARNMFDGSTASIAATWPAATTSGHLLVACMGLRWAGAITITPPAGWQQAIDASPQSGESRVRIWYIASAASRSGPETWTFSNGVTYQVGVTIVEYAGPTALDQMASNTGTSATLSTGATPQTTADRELWFACTDATGAYTQSTPSDGFSTITTAVVGTMTSGLTAGWYERFATAKGNASTSTTIEAAREWSAAVVTFR